MDSAPSQQETAAPAGAAEEAHNLLMSYEEIC